MRYNDESHAFLSFSLALNIIPYYGDDKIRKVQELILDVFTSVNWNGARS